MSNKKVAKRQFIFQIIKKITQHFNLNIKYFAVTSDESRLHESLPDTKMKPYTVDKQLIRSSSNRSGYLLRHADTPASIMFHLQ